jgi:hypothetical protein
LEYVVAGRKEKKLMSAEGQVDRQMVMNIFAYLGIN